jgi:hypothetical protein
LCLFSRRLAGGGDLFLQKTLSAAIPGFFFTGSRGNCLSIQEKESVAGKHTVDLHGDANQNQCNHIPLDRTHNDGPTMKQLEGKSTENSKGNLITTLLDKYTTICMNLQCKKKPVQ